MANYQITNRTGAQVKAVLDKFTTAASPETLTLTGAISGGSLSISGAISGGSLSVTNAISGGSLTASGAISGGSLSVTNAISGGTTLVIGTQKSGTTLGTNATILGNNGTASGNYSHAEGSNTTASASTAHAEGSQTIARAVHAHAEGYTTTASGGCSHAEGSMTVASGDAGSHAQNLGTIAAKDCQTALGTYNEEDTSGVVTHPSGHSNYGEYAVIIGNGTGPATSERSNALTVDWSGNTHIMGNLIVGGNIKSETITKSTAVTSSAGTNLGNICNWKYKKSSDGYVEGYATINTTLPSYATIIANGLYGYYCDVTLPETFDSNGIIAFTTWNIGSGFGLGSSLVGNLTTTVRLLGIGNVSGSQTVKIKISFYGMTI